MVNPMHLTILQRGVHTWNQWRQQHRDGPPDLSRANLAGANLASADLRAVNLAGANLSHADLFEADLYRANLSGADLHGANLGAANLFETNLSRANLREARLSEANVSEAMMERADLSGADLRWARLDRANLREATLAHCRVYGISASQIICDQSNQTHLCLAEKGTAGAIDHLEMSQFITLMQQTRLIDQIDSLVLLVGTFTEREKILETYKGVLERHHYLPITWDLSVSQETQEASLFLTLARLSRFMLLDITSVERLPPMLQTLMRQRILPLQPLLDGGQRRRKASSIVLNPSPLTPWVLPAYRYRGLASFKSAFQEKVLEPMEEMVQQWW